MTPLRYLLPATAILCFIGAAITTAATVIEDRFDSPKASVRRDAESRGSWGFAQGIATCTQDDATFEKNKDHGPVLWYDKLALKDGTIQFSLRSEKVQTFVLTLNSGGGHAFRIRLDAKGVTVLAFEGEGHEAKPKSLVPKDAKTPPLQDGVWITISLKFQGDQCTVAVGPDFTQTFKNPAIAKVKDTLGLGFAYGTLSLRELKIVAE